MSADSAEPKATTAAPNSTTGQAETAVVPEQEDTTSASGPVAAATSTATDASANGDAAGAAKPNETESTAGQDSKSAPEPIQQLWLLAKAHEHSEIWGVQLADPDTHVPSQVVFQKFLNAYDGDLAQAKETLTKTLDWRKQTKPLDLLSKAHKSGKFEGLGYVTSYGPATSGDPESKEVFTWNIYGGIPDINNTFGDLEEFIAWRIALMELALQELSISTATRPISAEFDPYKIYQVHDYKSISFFRQSAQVRSASTETIRVFAANYPELLKEKFFVNVPAIMGFMYGLMKMFVARKTIKKFHPMSNSKAMVHEFGDSKVEGLGKMLPPDYGGEGPELSKDSKQVHLE